MLDLEMVEKKLIFKKEIPLKEINLFCKQFLAMLQAGMHMTKALKICISGCNHKALKVSLEQVYESVVSGYSLAQAMRRSGVFPNLLVNLVSCGEAVGTLDDVLREVVIYFDEKLEVKNKIQKALIYPAIVLGTVIIVMIILMIEVIPNFSLLLTETGTQMPMATKVVISISEFFIKYGITISVILSCILGGSYLAIKSKQGKLIFDGLRLKLPIIGYLNKKMLTASFASTMSMLITAGIPILQAIEMTKEIVTNTVAQKELESVMNDLQQGSSLYEALKESLIYPPMLFQMIYIGEEIGAVDEMLMKIGTYFKSEVNQQVAKWITIIEPALTLMLAIIVGGVMLAIMQPMFSAATAII